MTEERFDQIVEELRGETAPSQTVADARERVRTRLANSASALCSEFRGDLGAYLRGEIAESRRLLLQDHLSRCADCRNALAEVKGVPKVVEAPVLRTRRAAWQRWALAAGILLAASFAGRHQLDRAFAPRGARATVASVSGEAMGLSDLALAPGAELFEGDSIRTGANARVILALADGSRVEVNQRTQLSVRAAWSGQTLMLDYGDVLVEAAPQSRGRLRVITRDSTASVKGTVFAVSSAVAGSLVSVVEGEVEVEQPGSHKLLHPGEQAASTVALRSVGMKRAIAWSAEAEKYFGVLAGLVAIEQDLAELTPAGSRTEPYLLSQVPAGTRIYVAVPNLNGTVQQAIAMLDQRAAQNAALAEWWQSGTGHDMREAAERMQTVAPLLGEEIVFAIAANPGRPSEGMPLVIAQVQPGREEDLVQALAALADGESAPYEVAGGLLLATDSGEHLTIIRSSLGSGASSPFAAQIAARYIQGVSWLGAIDVAAIGSEVGVEADAAALLGLSTMRYLFLARNSADGAGGSEAALTFEGGRTGLANWLASPGSAGSAEYVSSDAIAAFSASTRNPREALDEMIGLLGAENPLARGLADFETETGVNVSLDIAASLGSDVTFAIERPTIPIPGWILAFETANPGALDETARRLVEAFNEHGQADGGSPALAFSRETVNGREWRSVSLTGGESVQESARGMALHWTYDGGYLIASTDRALSMTALTVRQSGSPLIRSDAFLRSFPSTSSLHHSGFFWLNTSGVAADLAGLSADPALQSLLRSREPLLVVIDGDAERIHAATRTRLTSAVLDALLLGGIGQASPVTD